MGGVAAGFSALATLYYFSNDCKPLMLDNRDIARPVPPDHDYSIREITPWIPYSMNEVEDYLRLRQNSVLIVRTENRMLKL